MKQAQGTKNMTVGDPKRLIISFAVPVFFSQLFQQLYNSVDSLIVGNFLGKEALAAVSSSGSLIFLFTSFFVGTSMGAGVVISRHFGAKNDALVSAAIHTVVCLGLICGVFMSILGVWASPVVLRWMGTAPEVLPESVAYFRVYFCGSLTLVMYNIFNGIMTALGDSRRPLCYLVFSSSLNIVLDLLFVGGFRWGVWAAALATILSQGASAVLCLFHLTWKGTVYQLTLSRLRIHKTQLREILRIGIPNGIQNSVISVGNVIIQSNINTFGADAMAGCGSYFKIEGFVFLPITCFGMALTTYIGQNLGAKEYDRAKQGARFGLIMTMVLAEAIGLVLYFASPFLVALFNSDPDVVAVGVQQTRTECFFYFALALSHTIAGICRGAGRSIVPMVVMLGCWCALRIAYVTVAMQLYHHIVLVFLAYPITWLTSSVIYLIYYHCSDWVHGFEYTKKASA